MRAVLFLVVCLTVPVAGQCALPPCNPNVAAASWTNCQGTVTLPSGEKYVGEFRDGKRYGQGTNTLANGGKYVGEYRDDKPNGQGTETWANGDKYVGEYSDNKRNGQGTFTWAGGDKYVGEWRDDTADGQGTYTTAIGHRYVGEFRDGKPNGQGILTYADARPPEEGVFEDGKLVRSQRIPDHIAGRSAAQPDRGQQTTGGTVNPPAPSPQSNLDVARKKCGDLGLKSGTEKFGECVLNLSR